MAPGQSGLSREELEQTLGDIFKQVDSYSQPRIFFASTAQVKATDNTFLHRYTLIPCAHQHDTDNSGFLDEDQFYECLNQVRAI